MNLEECNQCYTNHVQDGEPNIGDIGIDLECEDHLPAISDHLTVLGEHANITNASMQVSTYTSQIYEEFMIEWLIEYFYFTTMK